MNVFDVAFMFIVYIIGSLLSLVITGFLVNKLVITKILANQDIKDIIKLIKEGKDALKKILENQKDENS